MSGFFMTVWLL